ncbi:type II secretion system protein H (GspH) [Hephaestia caeni]|uniref:Type II secretion system protein H n=1 Tax=Hephaestia caeni TaxID=645617 RepID=A0A397PCA5_9SPHN|nr:GspH/FimT family pseudopilin [Hephaestia caeni]RIA45579.1 type II secretion system protein H (GspH) [Hephaestia caeni]
MPTSIPATFEPRGVARDLNSLGFTLAELMVVLVILGLASAAVVMTIPDSGSGVRDDMQRFAARLSAARDRAIVAARPMSVWVAPSGYGFAQRIEGEWVPLDDKPFVTTDWRHQAIALVDASGPARVTFDTTGAAVAPLTITLVRNDARASVSVTTSGKVTIDE